MKLARSETKQFCETSSIFELATSKTKQFYETSFNNGKLSAELTASTNVPMSFAIFPVHVSEVLRLPRKGEARSYEVLHLSHKIIFPKLKI